VFCNIPTERVISAPDVKSIYDVPGNYEKDGLGDILTDVLSLPQQKTDMGEWEKFVEKSKNANKEVEIAVVGKYFSSGEFVLSDVYISVLEAVKTAAYHLDLKPKITYLSSQDFESGKMELSELDKFGGILVPGGFGVTGVEGKIQVIEYARTHKIPYFGICYGMQLAVVEYARNVAGMKDAHTAEIKKNIEHPVIDIMESQKDIVEKGNFGGTMRLGAYPCVLKDGTLARDIFGTEKISERHRHRYEVNPKFVSRLEDAGMIFSGTSPDGILMEVAELPRDKHPFFIGIQSHPEFLSRPLTPHPIFSAFIKAASENK
jgi:CTP synthase